MVVNNDITALENNDNFLYTTPQNSNSILNIIQEKWDHIFHKKHFHKNIVVFAIRAKLDTI